MPHLSIQTGSNPSSVREILKTGKEGKVQRKENRKKRKGVRIECRMEGKKDGQVEGRKKKGK